MIYTGHLVLTQWKMGYNQPSMWTEWGRWGLYTAFLLGIIHLENSGDGMITLRWIIGCEDGR